MSQIYLLQATNHPIRTFNSVLRFVKDAHNKHLSIKFPRDLTALRTAQWNSMIAGEEGKY
jgi:hypothetical protein